jgi:hydrogenase maturation protein HypF
MALAHLRAAGVAWDPDLPCVRAAPEAERRVLGQQLARNLNVVPTSSMGRLFDAIASLAGVRAVVSYEAQAAIELESLVDLGADGAYAFALDETQGVFDAAPVVAAAARDVAAGVPAGVVGARFHRGVAQLMVDLARRLRAVHGLQVVALSGGVFQNVTLLGLAVTALQAAGFTVHTHRRVPPNDGGLALGQILIGQEQAGT